MTARERWQALHTNLTAARAAVGRGDSAAALAAVDAALDIDPNFLAAQSLRDRILAGELTAAPEPPPPIESAGAGVAPPPAAIVAPDETSTRPLVSVDGYAKFEQRARRRRVDQRIDAARQAIEKKRLKQAAAALDEVIELDPNLPELSDLTAQFDELRRSAAATRRGPWLAAGIVFAGSVFGASWLQESSPLLSRSMIASAPLLAAPTPSVSVEPDLEPVATTGRTPIEPAGAPIQRFVPSPPAPAATPASYTAAPIAVAAVRPAVEPLADAIPIAPPPSAPQPTPSPIAPPRPVQEAPIAAPITVPMPPKMDDIDEHAMVRQTLQRYRSAYEGLDAQSAHAVWPAVNQVALARAFDGLESQSLTFDACDVRVRGEAATAICQGSARYVPKIGNRQPRVEPRVWNFTLHKSGTDWKIDSARAER